MKTCERCGSEFICQPEQIERCWCSSVTRALKIPHQYGNCLCPKCLHCFSTEAGSKAASPLEGVDYFFEYGLMVFTEQYLANRGYCCGSGCRNCPY